MNKCFENYIVTRCEEQLSNSSKYIDIQKQMADAHKKHDMERYIELSMQLQFIIEKESYEVAACDICSLVYKSRD